MRKIIIYLPFTLLMLMTIISCAHEFIDIKQPYDLSIGEVRSVFEKQVHTFEVKPFILSNKTREDEKSGITPLWDKAYLFSNTTGDYIEVPLNLPIFKVFPRTNPQIAVPKENKYPNTIAKLLIQRTIDDNHIYNIIHITGDSLFMSKGKTALISLHIDDLSKFSGQIRYFDLNAKLLWGTIYKSGAVIGNISVATDPNIK
ncbi:hypothetical protein [Bacteroides sp.]